MLIGVLILELPLLFSLQVSQQMFAAALQSFRWGSPFPHFSLFGFNLFGQKPRIGLEKSIYFNDLLVPSAGIEPATY